MLTSRHKQTCHEILTLLEMTEGFELLFIECNPPILQQELEQYLEAQNTNFRWIKIRLEHAIENLREELLEQQLQLDAHTVLSVSGLEHSIHTDQETAPVVARLNVARDILPGQFPCPLLLWLPRYALQHVARFAPDLWSWRAHVFYVEAPEGAAQPRQLLRNGAPADSYSKAFKEGEIAFLTPIVEAFDPTTASRQELKKHAENVFQLAQYHYRLSHFNEALSLFKRAETCYQQLEDQARLADCYNNIGLIHNNKGDWDLALDYYLNAEQIRLETGDRAGLGTTYNNIGGIYDNKGDSDQALDYYLKAEQIRLEVSDRVGLGTTYTNIGAIYSKKGEWDRALDYFLRAETIMLEVGNRAGLGTIYNNIGLIYAKKGAWDRALSYYFKDEQITLEIGDQAGLGTTYNNIGLIYANKGDWDRALDYYLKDEQIMLEVGNRAGLVTTYFNIGTIHLHKKDKEKANNYLILAGYLATKLDMKHDLSEMAWALDPIIKEFGKERFLKLGKQLRAERGL